MKRNKTETTEIGTISERIAQIVQHFNKGNKSAFARAVGISGQGLGEMVGKRQGGPSFGALQKILTAFPQLRAEWVLFGRGPMSEVPLDPLLTTPPAGAEPPPGLLPSLLLLSLISDADQAPPLRSRWYRFLTLPVELSAGRHLSEPALVCYAPGLLPDADAQRLTVHSSAYQLSRHLLEVVLVEKEICGPKEQYHQVLAQLAAVGWKPTFGTLAIWD